MTNYEKIKNMDREELVKFLLGINFDYVTSPWEDYFTENYCNGDCPIITRDNHDYTFCEVNHYCKCYFDLTGIKKEMPSEEETLNLWLDSETTI